MRLWFPCCWTGSQLVKYHHLNTVWKIKGLPFVQYLYQLVELILHLTRVRIKSKMSRMKQNHCPDFSVHTMFWPQILIIDSHGRPIQHFYGFGRERERRRRKEGARHRRRYSARVLRRSCSLHRCVLGADSFSLRRRRPTRTCERQRRELMLCAELPKVIRLKVASFTSSNPLCRGKVPFML